MSVTKEEKSFEVLDSNQRTRSIAYAEWRSTMCTLEKPKVVVCVHGLTRNSHDFDYIAPAIAGFHNYVVYALDVVGRGRSDYLTAGEESYGYAIYVKDAERFLHHIGVTQVDFWIGTSMGGLIGMHMHQLFPGTIKNLILNDIGTVVPKEGLVRLASYVGANRAFDTLDDVVAYCKDVYSGFGSNLPDDRWLHIAKTSVFTCVELNKGVLRLMYDPLIAVGFSEIPNEDLDLGFLWEDVKGDVLLLRGAESDMLTKSCAARMTDKAQNEGKRNVTLIEFPDTKHAPSLMETGQIFAVLDWILHRP